MMLMKFLPFVPGRFSGWEWLALGIWILLGVLIGRPRAPRGNFRENALDSGLN
jgi:hypothetical protein